MDNTAVLTMAVEVEPTVSAVLFIIFQLANIYLTLTVCRVRCLQCCAWVRDTQREAIDQLLDEELFLCKSKQEDGGKMYRCTLRTILGSLRPKVFTINVKVTCQAEPSQANYTNVSMIKFLYLNAVFRMEWRCSPRISCGIKTKTRKVLLNNHTQHIVFSKQHTSIKTPTRLPFALQQPEVPREDRVHEVG